MRWTVGRKISLGYLVATLLLLAVGLLTQQGNTRLQVAREADDRTIETINQLADLEGLIGGAEIGQRDFLLTGNEQYLAPYRQLAAQIAQTVLRLRALDADGASLQALTQVQETAQTGLTEMQKLVAIRRDAGLQPALEALYASKRARDWQLLRQQVQAIKAAQLRQSQRRSSAIEESGRLASLTVRVGIPLAVLVMLLGGVWIIRDISRPLQKLATVARDATSGDLSLSLDIKPRSDELGALCKAFAEMGAALREKVATAAAIARGELHVRPRLLSVKDELGLAFVAMVENLQGTVINLQSGSLIMSEVASTVSLDAEQVVGTANETATATLQLANTVDELRQTTTLTLQRMESVSDRAEVSAEAALQGQAAVRDAASSMYEVRNRMRVLAERTESLTDKREAISEIVTVVSELAEQSTVLAVNAGLEAARAGEHGGAFSMVAAEMRNLAGQSKQAVLTVRTILDEVQRLIQNVVDAAMQSTEAVSHGVTRSETAGNALARMAEIVQDNQETAREVTTQATKQVAGITQIAAAIHQIKASAGDNLFRMQNIQLAIVELELASRQLQTQVAAFKA